MWEEYLKASGVPLEVGNDAGGDGKGGEPILASRGEASSDSLDFEASRLACLCKVTHSAMAQIVCKTRSKPPGKPEYCDCLVYQRRIADEVEKKHLPAARPRRTREAAKAGESLLLQENLRCWQSLRKKRLCDRYV
jgi:hypothetical protein